VFFICSSKAKPNGIQVFEGRGKVIYETALQTPGGTSDVGKRTGRPESEVYASPEFLPNMRKRKVRDEIRSED
jgi:hypothetical protein